MKRVYLMADFGRGPVTLSRFNRAGTEPLAAGPRERADAAKSWWLVEAANAWDARLVIHNDRVTGQPGNRGRIIERGGNP